MNKKIYRVGFYVDGSFLPIRNGVFYSIYNLMKYLAATGRVRPYLIINYRGWDDPKLYSKQPFTTIFVPATARPDKARALAYACSAFDIDCLHMCNAEEINALGPVLKKYGLKIIYEAINVDHTLYGGLDRNSQMVRFMKKQQARAITVANHTLCRSNRDRRQLAGLNSSRHAITVYRGAIDANAIQFKIRKRKRFRIAFLGHGYYPPNENAIRRLATIVLPKLKKLDRRYCINIMGPVSEALRNKYSGPGTVFFGGTKNLSRELLASDIAVAPILEASGTSLKVLDYLASGLPLVATSVSVRGLHPSVRDACIIEDDITAYADRIHGIMQNYGSYSTMTVRGRKFVERYYHWPRCLEPFLQIYKKLCKKI
ncbi:MAG: glycosyltransferase [Patescibacteria group bacterium]